MEPHVLYGTKASWRQPTLCSPAKPTNEQTGYERCACHSRKTDNTHQTGCVVMATESWQRPSFFFFFSRFLWSILKEHASNIDSLVEILFRVFFHPSWNLSSQLPPIASCTWVARVIFYWQKCCFVWIPLQDGSEWIENWKHQLCQLPRVNVASHNLIQLIFYCDVNGVVLYTRQVPPWRITKTPVLIQPFKVRIICIVSYLIIMV